MTFGISAIVTGGASGLGRATVSKLASRGAGVVIFDLPGSEGEAVAKSFGDKVVFCPGDVTSPEDAQKAAELAKDQFGSLQGKKIITLIRKMVKVALRRFFYLISKLHEKKIFGNRIFSFFI